MTRPNLWGVAMVKDEADVIAHTIRHVAAQGVEGIYVMDNESTDGTGDILRALAKTLPCALIVATDDQVGYYQSAKMTAAAEFVHAKMGADWILPFDADEVWGHVSGHPLADVLHAADGHIVHAQLFNHYTTDLDPPFRGDDGGNPMERMPYRMPDPQPLPKVMVKWAPNVVIQAGNHGCQHVGGWDSTLAGVRVHHFPYRSEDQFVRKVANGAAAYRATNLPWETGMHWREYGVHLERGGEQALRDIYRAHFHYPAPTASGLVYDPITMEGAA